MEFESGELALTEEELLNIPATAIEKLKASWKSKESDVLKLKADLEKLRVQANQQSFDLEKQLEESLKKLEAEQSKASQFETKASELQSKLEASTTEFDLLKKNSANYNTQLETITCQQNKVAEENKELLHILEKRNVELEQLKEELRSVAKQYTTANLAKNNLLLEVDRLTCEESALKHQVNRLELDKQSLNKEVEHLSAEISQATSSLFSARSEQMHKQLDLQSKFDKAAEELCLMKDVKESLQKVIEDQNSKLEKLSNQLKEQRDANIKAESQFGLGLQSQVKLTNLYKSSLEETQERVNELLTAIEELQKLLKQAAEENGKMHESIELNKSEFQSVLTEKNDQISRLENELEKANELLVHLKKRTLSDSDVESMSPSAAAASRLLKSGKSLTQIYAEYISIANQLQEEKENNARIAMYFDQIRQEIEANAPALRNQREEYEKAMETISALTQQLNMSVKQHDIHESKVNEAVRKSKILHMENEELKKSCSDLGQQVCFLLKRVEEAEGRIIPDNDDDSNMVSSTEAVGNSAAKVVSEKLVTFKNLQDLQNQNQKLLAVVRDLSDMRQQEEQELCNSKIAELQKELDEKINEIKELREAQNRQNNLVESIVKQRNMYKVLLSQTAEGKELNLDVTGTPLASNLHSPEQSSQKKGKELAAALEQMKEEFAAYKTKTAENNKIHQDQVEKMQEERLELRLYGAKISSQLEYATERYNTVRDSLNGFKKEISTLSARNEQISNLSAKNEEIVCTLRNELLSMQDKLSRAEVSAENLRQEKMLLKQAEARLQGEIDTLRRERSGQSVLLANLQTIQNNLEKSDSDTKALLANRILSLEKEVSALQSKLNKESERYNRAADALEKHRQESQARLQTEISKHSKTRDELVSAYSSVHELRQEISVGEAKVKTLESMISKSMSTPVKTTPSNANVATVSSSDDLALQLKEAQNEIESLQSQVQKSHEHLTQFKSMASSLEEQLKEHNAANCDFQANFENLLKEKTDIISKLEEESILAKLETNKLQEQNRNLMSEHLAKDSELRNELQKTTIDLQNALQTLEDCKKSEQEARQEFQSQAQLAREAHENYERELMLHASDLKTLEALRKDYDGHEKKIEAAEELARKSEIVLKENTASWQEQEKCLKEQLGHLDVKCRDLDEQNKLLHLQMEKISGQMIALQSKEGVNISFSEDPQDQSNEHLVEIVKYLRKEKDIAVAKLDVVQTESERLAAKVKFLEKRLDETSNTLQEMQKKEQVSLSSASQHAELMRKVELLNILTDGNRVLREEKSQLGKSLEEITLKVCKLEAEIGPLRERNQELATQQDAIQAERKALQAEAKRWQSRTQVLVEQSQKTSPEDFKKALQEKEQFQKQALAAKEELARIRAETSALEATLANARKETETGKAEVLAKNQEIARLYEDLGAKDSSLADVNKTMQQVRKIGRKYKAQYDELKVQHDALKALADQAAEKAAQVSAEPVPNLAESVEAAKQEVRQELEGKIREVEEAQKAGEEKMKKLRATAYQRITQLTTLRDDQAEELHSLKSKITTMEESKSEDTAQSRSVQLCLENRITELEGDLKVAQNSMTAFSNEKSALKREVQNLTTKVNQQQKRVEMLQKQLKDASTNKSTSNSSARDSSILSQSGPDSVPPPTANIKPMAAPGSSVVRHPHPAGSSMRTTPMGRIRPITAVSHAASRTATIPPTTAAAHAQHQEIDDSHQMSPSSSMPGSSSVPQATVAPTPVIAKPAIIPTPAVVHEAIHLPVVAQTSAFSEDISQPEVDIENPSTETDSTEVNGADSETISSSQSQDNLKRSREETEFDLDEDVTHEAALKKQRSCLSSEEREHDSSPRVSHSSDIPQAAVQGHVQVSPSQHASFETESTSIEHGPELRSLENVQSKPVTMQIQQQELEIILVESDEENDKIEVDEQLEAVEEDITVGGDVDEERDVDDGEEQIISEQFDDVDVEEPEEEADDEQLEEFQDDNSGNVEEQQFPDPSEEIEENEDNDIEIIEQTEEPQVESSNANVPHTRDLEPPPVQPQSTHPMFLPRISTHSERYLQSQRSQQPASYSLNSSNAGFEDGDSIVPSTPTLFDSRRNDGFAEAVSSPHVPPERFLFGSTVETPSQLASQGALGMDDTRMDLTQFDDVTGRSVPSTPHQVSPSEGPSSELTADAASDSSGALPQGQLSEPTGSEINLELRNVPTITITAVDDGIAITPAMLAQIDESLMGISDIIEPENSSDVRPSPSTSADGPKIVSVATLSSASPPKSEERKEEIDSGTAAETVVPVDVEAIAGSSTDDVETSQRSDNDQQTQRRTTPIIWDPPRPPGRGRSHGRGMQQQQHQQQHQQQQQQQHMNRPFTRRGRGNQNPTGQGRLGFRHMGRGRMPPRGRPYLHQRHPNNF